MTAVRSERDRLRETVDAHLRDGIAVDTVLALERERGFHRRLRPAAHGIRLEILLEDPPARAEVAPAFARRVGLDGQRGRAGESALREERGAHPGVRAPARAVLEHRRVLA